MDAFCSTFKPADVVQGIQDQRAATNHNHKLPCFRQRAGLFNRSAFPGSNPSSRLSAVSRATWREASAIALPRTQAPKMTDQSQASDPYSLELQDKLEYLGPNGSLRHFKNKAGQNIACYYWPAAGSSMQKPRGVLHLLHGHGAYTCYDYLRNQGPGRLNAYTGSWVEGLNKAGYSVTAIDLHGAGRSEGIRCYTNSFDDYVDEIQQHVRLTPEEGLAGFPPIKPPAGVSGEAGKAPEGAVPRYVLGGSMGGCLATLVSMRMPDVVSGIVLLAPMLSLEKVSQRGINRYLKVLAPIVSGLFPTLPCVAVSHNSLYPELQQAYDHDRNNWHGQTRARNGWEYVRTTHMLMYGGMEKVTCPFLVFHGLQDDMCDPDGSRALHERAQSSDKTLKLLDHMWHVLQKEPGNPGVLADIIAWLDERTATNSMDPAAVTNKPLLDSLRADAAAQYSALAAARPELIEHFAKGKAKAEASMPTAVPVEGAQEATIEKPQPEPAS